MTALLSMMILVIASATHGQVLTESPRDLGYGFRAVNRSQVNPPGFWEGIGHVSFVYFHDTELCQCSANEFFVSPTGTYSIYADTVSGRLTVFDTRIRASRNLTTDFVGLPKNVEWNERDHHATVFFYQDVPDHRRPPPCR
jgi:hypothetical protein